MREVRPLKYPESWIDALYPYSDDFPIQDLLVYSTKSATPIQFVLTRYKHMSPGVDVPFTVTIMFKGLPHDLLKEAWRILMHITKDKQLIPEIVLAMYHLKINSFGDEDRDVADFFKGRPSVFMWAGERADSASSSSPVGPSG